MRRVLGEIVWLVHAEHDEAIVALSLETLQTHHSGQLSELLLLPPSILTSPHLRYELRTKGCDRREVRFTMHDAYCLGSAASKT